MNKTFYNLIRDIVEVYVDDIVVKTKVGSTLVEDFADVVDWLLDGPDPGDLVVSYPL